MGESQDATQEQQIGEGQGDGGGGGGGDTGGGETVDNLEEDNDIISLDNSEQDDGGIVTLCPNDNQVRYSKTNKIA